MTHADRNAELLATRNSARFFTENRHVSWVLLLATLLWGLVGYRSMPQRKDPEALARTAVALCAWPGASADKIEQLVTTRIEAAIAESSTVERITSNSRTGVTVVTVRLDESVRDRRKEFDDIKGKLDSVRDLPEGAGPVVFLKDFGDTAALLLTVASPPPGEIEVALRAAGIRRAVETARAQPPAVEGPGRLGLVYSFPQSVSSALAEPLVASFIRTAEDSGVLRDIRRFAGPGFVGIDAASMLPVAEVEALVDRFLAERVKSSEVHPDAWGGTVFAHLDEIETKLASGTGARYSYRELDRFADLIKRTLQGLPQVSRVTVAGLLEERVVLSYSQDRLASYGIRPRRLPEILGARNITVPGGVVEIGDKNLRIDPSGELSSEAELGGILVPVDGGQPVYLRDLVDISRTYQLPPRFLNFYGYRDADSHWRQARAVTLAVQMRPGLQIAEFGRDVDAALADLRVRLPDDLIIARTSDQPRQVKENIDLFMSSLYEAVVLVVLSALVGFWAWRPALLMAIAIPITLAMTFGMMHLLGVDLQQVSIASLIIALGLLVDDPVVAGDAIRRELAAGRPPIVAAWLGPTRLATAILYATITNIVAYLPFLLLTAETGNFLRTLPIVISCSLVASRLVSMTFIPLLGYYLLRPATEPTIAERRDRGFAARYYRVGRWALRHRWVAALGSLVILVAGGTTLIGMRTEFFPKDHAYLSYVDVWLPNDAPLSTTRATATRVEKIIQEVAEEYGHTHPDADGGPRTVLDSVTTFVGGGAPRFWFTLAPVQSQVNFAQLLIRVHDKHDTNQLVGALQRELSARVAGAHVDVQQLPTGSPVNFPIEVRVSGEDIPTLRAVAEEVQQVFRAQPGAARVRDDWGADSFAVRLEIDPERANLAGVTNLDVAASSAIGMNGFQVATLRDGDRRIPIVAQMRLDERARLNDLESLYVYASEGPQRVPLGQVSRLSYGAQTERIRRRNQFRTITVGAFPTEGLLASQVLRPMRPALDEIGRRLPPGYRLELGGMHEKQVEGFGELGMVMAISVAAIFLALVIQFRHAWKPFIVFAAIPFGIVGALVMLRLTGTPFGFMAFLGIASLVGVIVSNIIVLFDFIEEERERGAPLAEALLDAGIIRLQPVMVATGSTVVALVPLALNGGPLWAALCYAQIGGLIAATFITLLVVPVIYSIAVLDLKLVRWTVP